MWVHVPAGAAASEGSGPSAQAALAAATTAAALQRLAVHFNQPEQRQQHLGSVGMGRPLGGGGRFGVQEGMPVSGVGFGAQEGAPLANPERDAMARLQGFLGASIDPKVAQQTYAGGEGVVANEGGGWRGAPRGGLRRSALSSRRGGGQKHFRKHFPGGEGDEVVDDDEKRLGKANQGGGWMGTLGWS